MFRVCVGFAEVCGWFSAYFVKQLLLKVVMDQKVVKHLPPVSSKDKFPKTVVQKFPGLSFLIHSQVKLEGDELGFSCPTASCLTLDA